MQPNLSSLPVDELSEEEFSQTIPFNLHRVTALSVAQGVLDLAPFRINVPGTRVLIVVLQNESITLSKHMRRGLQARLAINRLSPPRIATR
jgi:hypothetical protein